MDMKKVESGACAFAQALMKNKKGEVLISPLILLIFMVVFILNANNVFGVIIMKQNVTHISKTLMQTIELEGRVSYKPQEELNRLNRDLGTDATFEVTDVKYYNYGNKSIQFRDPFTITVTDVYDYEILSPAFGDPLVLHIPIHTKITGMSEVYWK